jgi:hypothetical protein
MRVRVVFTAIAVMAAAPAWAQSTVTLASRTIMPAHVMCADLLLPALPTPTRRIAGAHSPEVRLAMNRGDLAVLPRLPEDGYAVGQRYLVQRMPSGERANLPKEGGYVPIRTLGWLTVTAVDDNNAMGLIDYACDAIEPDDFLVAYVEPVLPSPDPAMPAPDFTERVQILPGEDGKQMFGAGDMFSIARGTDDGVAVGARYAIYRDRRDGKPLVHVGEAIAADPSASTAKLILTRMLSDAVEVSDIAVPRRQH